VTLASIQVVEATNHSAAQPQAEDAPTARTKKGVLIRSFGCQMNVYDSQRIEAMAVGRLGLEPTEDPASADLIVLNTCSVRDKAEQKVYSELGRLRTLKEANPDLVIAVAGCVAQQEGEAIQKRAPYVDIVVGPQSLHHLEAMVAQVRRDRVKASDLRLDEIAKFDALPEAKAEGPTAFVTVMEGCDKFCTFCIVPYTRGPEISRPVEDIESEVRRLIAQGVIEVTLLGQNVNAYRGQDSEGTEYNLALLLRRLSLLNGLKRLRFTTSYPSEVDQDLIEAFAELPLLAPFLHLPVQSGSDAVLAKMKRNHTAAEYRDLVRRLREARPDLALSSDFIVGFPGESDADFEATLALIDAVGFHHAYSFKYSPRPGTPAARIEDDVPEKVKEERLARVQDRVKIYQRQALDSRVGAIEEVVVEGFNRDGDLFGRTAHNWPIHFAGAHDLIGTLVKVKVVRALGNSLRGEVAS